MFRSQSSSPMDFRFRSKLSIWLCISILVFSFATGSDAAQDEIDFELQVAAAEKLQVTAEDPQTSLGIAVNSTLQAIASREFSDQTRQNYLDLSETRFLQSLINDSEAVALYRKPELSLVEASSLLKLFLRIPVQGVGLECCESKLKKKLAHSKGPVELDSVRIVEKEDLLQLLGETRRPGASLSLAQLIKTLDIISSQPIPPDSEKILLKMRDILRDFTGNKRWTATDLLVMQVSLNFALLVQALSITRPDRDEEILLTEIRERIHFLLDQSTIQEITENLSKPHLPPPPERRIFKQDIHRYVQHQLDTISQLVIREGVS